MKFVNLSEHQGKNRMDRRPSPTQSVTFTRGLFRGGVVQSVGITGGGFPSRYSVRATAANGSWVHLSERANGYSSVRGNCCKWVVGPP